jgi:hypothetical protein
LTFLFRNTFASAPTAGTQAGNRRLAWLPRVNVRDSISDNQ